jgi:hypothetical protein
VKSLAFGGRGTYNPANREKGSGAFVFEQVSPSSPGPCQEERHSKAGSERKEIPTECLLLKVLKNTIPEKAISQRSKEPY